MTMCEDCRAALPKVNCRNCLNSPTARVLTCNQPVIQCNQDCDVCQARTICYTARPVRHSP